MWYAHNRTTLPNFVGLLKISFLNQGGLVVIPLDKLILELIIFFDKGIFDITHKKADGLLGSVGFILADRVKAMNPHGRRIYDVWRVSPWSWQEVLDKKSDQRGEETDGSSVA